MRKEAIASAVSRLTIIQSHPMLCFPAQDDGAPGTAATASSSCFALAWCLWLLCALHVVLVFSSVAIAAVLVILLPFACMAASLCLVCATTALLLAPPDGAAERRGGGSDNDGGSDREEEENEGETDGYEFSDARGDEHERVFWVDTGSYYCYKKFYHLLAFWRRKERAGRR